MERKKRAIALVAAGCLFLQAALAPRAARAEIVQLESGPVVYTWKDALEENSQAFGDWLIPGQTARFDDGIWLIEDSRGQWADDEVAQQNSPDIVRDIECLTSFSIAKGIPRETFEGLQVYVLPIYSFYVRGEPKTNTKDGMFLPFENCIYLAGLSSFRRTYLHEVGHLIASRYLEAPGNDWSMANAVGRSYLALKGINPEKTDLDMEAQLALPWAKRVGELWAEDFAEWAYEDYLQSKGLPKRQTISEQVESWFDRFAYSLSTKFMVAGEEVKAWPVILNDEDRFLVPLDSEIIARLHKEPSPQVPEGVPVIETYGAPMVPLREYAEALGARVEWDGETRTVTITPQEPAA